MARCTRHNARSMSRFLLICFGGAIGSGARYLTASWAAALLGAGFPWGTMVVNVSGSFLIGVVMHLGTSTDLLSEDVRLFLASGLLGGFTTYSSFNWETMQLIRTGHWGSAFANAAGTFVLCLGAGFAGIVVARMVFAR